MNLCTQAPSLIDTSSPLLSTEFTARTGNVPTLKLDGSRATLSPLVYFPYRFTRQRFRVLETTIECFARYLGYQRSLSGFFSTNMWLSYLSLRFRFLVKRIFASVFKDRRIWGDFGGVHSVLLSRDN